MNTRLPFGLDQVLIFGSMDLFERPRVLKHQVVRSRLEGLLEDLVEGDPFPAERELAEAFSVSRETIRQALRELLPIPISSRTSRCRRRCTPNSRGAESISAERRTRWRPLFPTRAKRHCYTSMRVRRCSCSSASRTTTGRSHRIPPLTLSRRPDGVHPDDVPRLTVSRSVPARYTGRSRCLRCRREPTTRARTHRSVAGHPQ